MKNNFLIIYLLLVTSFSVGQQNKIDSLKSIFYQTKNNNQKLQILTHLCNKMNEFGDAENEELKFYKITLNLGEDLQDYKSQAVTSYLLAQYYLNTENFDSAKYYGLLSNLQSKKAKLPKEELKSYAILGRIYNHFDYYKEAVSSYKKALNIYKKFDKEKKEESLQTLSMIYANLSVTYRNMDKDSLADYYVLLSSKMADKTKDYMRKSNMLATIAWTYEDLNNNEMAVKYFKLALKDSAKIKLEIYNIANHHGLGYVYGKLGKFDLALYHDSIALAYFTRKKNNLFMQAVLGNMARVFLQQDKTELALKYAKKALDISNKIKVKKAIIDNQILISNIFIKQNLLHPSKQILLRLINDSLYSNYLQLRHKPMIYKNLSFIEEKQKNWKKAFQYNSLYSLYQNQEVQKKLKHISGIETKYQAEKKEKENLQLKAEKAHQAMVLERENKRRWVLSIGLFTSLLSLIIFAYYFHRSQKQKKMIESLQRELHHRVKNNLSIINSLIEDIKDQYKDSKYLSKLTDLQNRIDSIYEIHKQLYQEKNLTDLNLKQYVKQLTQNLQHSLATQNIIIENKIDENIKIPVEKSFPIGLIINEFITNSLKHAFDQTENGKITIKMKKKENNYILTLSDNGKGLPPDFNIEKITSFGMNIMYLLSKQLKGDFIIESKKGVHIKIKFPK